eukprot:734386-Pleurochrysis_carterae.AAC.2
MQHGLSGKQSEGVCRVRGARATACIGLPIEHFVRHSRAAHAEQKLTTMRKMRSRLMLYH